MSATPSVPRPILVTGSHRSGTTWVGRVLARHPQVVYLHEPFNPFHDPGLCRAKFRLWFTYIDETNETAYLPALTETIRLQYHWRLALRHARTWMDRLRVTKKALECRWGAWLGKRALLKDPIAVFSAPWLASRFHADVVVMIRHPLAFAGSLKARGWTFPFSHFLQQPRLMAQLPAPLQERIEAFAHHPPNVVDQAALLWLVIYTVVQRYQIQYPQWLFLRHEDVAAHPEAVFPKILRHLDLPPTPRLLKWLHRTTRDASHYLDTWRMRLSPEEARRVLELVGELRCVFYPDECKGDGMSFVSSANPTNRTLTSHSRRARSVS